MLERIDQLEAANTAMNKENVFVLLPTYDRKSLCYQLPQRYQGRGVTIVVSPLLSLMEKRIDQPVNERPNCSCAF